MQRSLPFLVVSKIVSWLVILFGYPLIKILYGYKCHGRENLPRLSLKREKPPVIFISNHVLPLDPLLQASALLPRATYFTILEETLLTPVLGTFIRFLGGIPIPADPGRIQAVTEAMGVALEGRGRVLFYPEGECFLLNQELQSFKAGAFYYAMKFHAKIIPLVTVIKHSRRGIKAEVHIMKPIEAPRAEGKLSADLHKAIVLAIETRESIQNLIDAHGGDKTLYQGPMPRIKGINDKNKA